MASEIRTLKDNATDVYPKTVGSAVILSDGSTVEEIVGDGVKYTPQTLTEAQKEQARENIGIWSKTLYAEDNYLVIKAEHLDGVFAITSSGENTGYALLSITLVNDITATIVSGEGWIDTSVDVQMGIDESDGKEILVVGLAADNFPIKVALLGGSEPESVYVTDAVAFDGEPESMPWTELGAGGGESDVFWATYGTTTASEIDAACLAGKIVLCNYIVGGDLYIFIMSRNDPGSIWFTAADSNNIRWIRLVRSSGVWSNGNLPPENLAYKKTSWSATPSDTNYPSEKLVKDSIDAVVDYVDNIVGNIETLLAAI